MTLVVQNTIDPQLYNTLATLTGSQVVANKTLKIVKEPVTIAGTSPASTTNFDVVTQSIVVYNTTTNNFILNVRGDATTTLDSLVGVGESIGITLFVPNEVTGYYLTNVSIDGDTTYSNRSLKYQIGAAFSGGSANATDVYMLFLIKTASNTWTAYISQTKYG